MGAPALDIGAPDELAHATYVAHLAEGKGLPVFKLSYLDGSPLVKASEYEFHQPPLFYALDAAWVKLLGSPASLSQAFGTRARFLNALIGGLTVVVIGAAAWTLSKKALVAVVAASYAAFLPMNVALSAAISNDPLLILLCSATLLATLTAMKRGWTGWQSALPFVFAGLATITKTTGLTLGLPLVIGLVMVRPTKDSVKPILVGVFLALLCIVPIWARNTELYGDPLALKVFTQAFAGTAQKEFIEGIIQRQGGSPELDYWLKWVIPYTAESYIGVFGYMTVPFLGGLEYAAIIVALKLIGLVGLVNGLRKDRQASVLLLSFILVIALVFFRFNNQYFQAQGRYLLPSLLPASLFIGLAVDRISRPETKRLVLFGILIWLALPILAIKTVSTYFQAATSANSMPGSNG